tara:strand:+ start:2652 stop:3770 length:1119 start_codon:yes stop_codon:yes gene_type:complete
MASLQNAQIDQTYSALLKVGDNGAVDATPKAITDGAGAATNIEMSNTATNFVSGTVDFTGSTVSGLPADSDTTYSVGSVNASPDADIRLTGSDGTISEVRFTAGTNITLTEGAGSITIDAAGGGGAAGLVTGGQTDSMKSAATLSTLPAITLEVKDIAIGENARMTNTAGANLYTDGGGIAIGSGAFVNKRFDYNFANDKGGIAIGTGAGAIRNVTGGSIAIGYLADSNENGIAIGTDSTGDGNDSVAIGVSADAGSNRTTAIGHATIATGYGCIAIGSESSSTVGGFRGGAAAYGNFAQATALDAIAIGNNTVSALASAVALGDNVTAGIASTVSITELEVQLVGGGITMYSPNGTAYKLTVSDAGALVIS